MSQDIPPRRELCDCNVLSDASREPHSGIAFDARLNEYHIVHPGGGYMMIYYCPFCGGRVPKSQRHMQFMYVTHDEESRINELIHGLHTCDEVVARFGPPDADIPNGLSWREPADADRPPRGEAARALWYRGLSSQADVIFYVYTDGHVRGTWQAKPSSSSQ